MNGHHELVAMLLTFCATRGINADSDELSEFTRQYWSKRLAQLGYVDRLPGTSWCRSPEPWPHCRCWVCRCGGIGNLPIRVRPEGAS